MPTHDCSICEASGTCPIENIAPWLNEHEAETEMALHDKANKMADLCTMVTMSHPALLMCMHDIAGTAATAFIMGYHKGRTYQDVPEVFKSA